MHVPYAAPDPDRSRFGLLGLGVPPPTPSCGNILSEGRQHITCCTWLTTYSGLAIMLAVLAFNLMGDALRDLLDSRLQGEWRGRDAKKSVHRGMQDARNPATQAGFGQCEGCRRARC